MAIENPTKYVSVQRLGRFEEKLGQKYATQTAMAAAVADVTPDYIDIEDLEVGMTFPKNALLAINGISFQALRNTTDFPVTVLVESGHVVYDEDENGNKAFVVSDWTQSEDWEIWTDASIPRTLQNMTADMEDFESDINTEMSAFKQEIRNDAAQLIVLAAQSIKPGTKFTATSGVQYTAEQLLQAMAELMNKNVVADTITT